MAKTLELKFKNEEGKPVTISVDEPIEPVDPVAVSAAMDTILTADCFFSNGGFLVEKLGARVVERNVEEVVLG